jgi:hypothetical protein
MTTVAPPPAAAKSTQSKWTKEKRDKALADGKYMKLDNKSSGLLLSGSIKKWSTDRLFGYVPELRIAGLLSDPTATTPQGQSPLYYYLLNVVGLTQEQAYSVITNGTYFADSVIGKDFASDNVEEFKGPLAAQYRAELDSLSANRAAKPSTKRTTTYSLNEICNIAKSVKDGTAVAAAPVKAKSKAKATNGAPAVSRTKPLIQRVLALNPNKVMDVSLYDEKSNNAKSINMPSGANTKKVAVSVEITDPVSKSVVVKTLVSSRADTMQRALLEIFPEDATKVSRYLNIWASSGKQAATAAPVQNGLSGVSQIPQLTQMPASRVVTSPQVVTMPQSTFNPAAGVKSPVMSMNQLFGK